MLRLLLVDDDERALETLRHALRFGGREVVAHGDPREGWRAFAANPASFDLVITDHHMPWMSGLELAARILALSPGTPVLLASGEAPAETAAAFLALGGRAFLPKPIDLERLDELVRLIGDGAGARPPAHGNGE